MSAPTALAARLATMIEAGGPITVAEFMGHAVGHYYATREPFGRGGDFVTAPEVSQMFGEIVGAWLVQAWLDAGRPRPVRLVELGPGRGTLMADIVRTARLVPDFLASASLHLVETSPRLKRRQTETLAGAPLRPAWHDRLDELSAGFLLLVANEFFDALPIRQFVRADGAWRERVVGLDAAGRLAFGLGPGGLAENEVPPALTAAAGPGAILEVSPAATAVAGEIGGRVARHGGAALLVDYGHAETGLGDTLQAVGAHRFADPLAAVGDVDLTAHVDFSALARAVRAAGAAAWGPMQQGDFLLALGLLERAGRLGRDGDAALRDSLSAAVERLAGPQAMGRLFKVLAVTPLGPPPPPFGG